MQEELQQPYIFRRPDRTLFISSIVLAITGIALMFTFVGIIIGLPLLLIAGLLSLAGFYKRRTTK